jgi:hypothetical protein
MLGGEGVGSRDPRRKGSRTPRSAGAICMFSTVDIVDMGSATTTSWTLMVL